MNRAESDKKIDQAQHQLVTTFATIGSRSLHWVRSILLSKKGILNSIFLHFEFQHRVFQSLKRPVLRAFSGLRTAVRSGSGLKSNRRNDFERCWKFAKAAIAPNFGPALPHSDQRSEFKL
jgi:hypothetical protein